jgi:hypothetical protein
VVSLDEATEGVPGMCDIPNTILGKIRACDVFLADLTFVGNTDPAGDEPQLVSNPNVVFELGYAVDAKGFDRILGVMNVAYGEPERQMFDVKRRWAIRYDLPEDSDKPKMEAAERRLSKEIEGALRTILEKVVLPDKGEKALERFQQIRAEFESSIGEGSFHGLDRESGAIAITIVPEAVRNCAHSQLQAITVLPPGGTGSGRQIRGRSVVSFFDTDVQDAGRNRLIRCGVGEMTVEGVVLAADTYCLDRALHPRSQVVEKIIPSKAFEQLIVDSVCGYARALQQLDVPFPWRVGISLLRIAGYYMYGGPGVFSRGMLCPTLDQQEIVADPVIVRDSEEVSDRKPVAGLLKDTFDYIWRECGFPHSLNYDADGNWKGPF